MIMLITLMIMHAFGSFAHADFPVKGYPPEYDVIVAGAVTDAMLNQPDSRMIRFCPAWPKMDRAGRLRMYQDLVYGIAYAESGLDRSSMYMEPVEHFTKPDSVTGKPVISEGLTQLSYMDGTRYASCRFDYLRDRDGFIRDFGLRVPGSASWKSQNVGRSILRPDVHLVCAVGIISSLLTSQKRLKNEFADTLGAYWSVMRRARPGFKKVWGKMRERKSPCL